MSEREAWQVTDDAAVLYEQSFVPALFARVGRRARRCRRDRAGHRVLDVGCGTGVVAREAARRVGAEGRVVGLDLNPAHARGGAARGARDRMARRATPGICRSRTAPSTSW